MSEANDILFAPIATEVDFHVVARNKIHNLYEWRPISSRAHDWVAKYAPSMYIDGGTNCILSSYSMSVYGFIRKVAAKLGTTHDWARALLDGNFVFEDKGDAV